MTLFFQGLDKEMDWMDSYLDVMYSVWHKMVMAAGEMISKPYGLDKSLAVDEPDTEALDAVILKLSDKLKGGA